MAAMREGACVKDILVDHNSRALKALVAYTACFVEAYPELGPDNILPLSRCRFPHSDDSAPSAGNADKFDLGECMRGLLLPKLLVRSSFVALSGHDDEFSSIDEVSSNARRGVFLHPKMVVYIHVCMYIHICKYIGIYIYVCMYMNAYVFIYVCIHIHICIYIFMYIYIYVYIYDYVYVYICMYIYIYDIYDIYVYACVCVFLHAYVCVYIYIIYICIYVCICVHIYIYTYTYIHTFTYACMYN